MKKLSSLLALDIKQNFQFLTRFDNVSSVSSSEQFKAQVNKVIKFCKTGGCQWTIYGSSVPVSEIKCWRLSG